MYTQTCIYMQNNDHYDNVHLNIYIETMKILCGKLRLSHCSYTTCTAPSNLLFLHAQPLQLIRRILLHYKHLLGGFDHTMCAMVSIAEGYSGLQV